MSRKLFLRWMTCLAGIALLVSGCERKPTTSPTSGQADVRHDATVDVVEKLIPSVVNIATEAREHLEKKRYAVGPFVYETVTPTGEKLISIGSGIILEQVGDEVYILTNFHVVNDENGPNQLPPRIHVQLAGGEVYEAQRLVWTTQKDLALLKIRLGSGKKVQGVRFAKDDDLLLGETVIAVGNPLGLGGSVSRGILSSKNRRFTPGNGQLGFPDWLQTDADINPGNSGGPLVNLHGEVIGINSAIIEDKEGSGVKFAIPVKQISYALSEIFSLEYTADMWLGAIFSGTQLPLTVRFVQHGGPADRAGLKAGQQVLEVNGQPVTGLVNFNSLVAGSPERRARFTVADGGRKRDLEATLVPLLDLIRDRLQAQLGIKTAKFSTNNSPVLLPVTFGERLVVTQVETNSPAAIAGVVPGLILDSLQGEVVKIGGLASATQALGNKKPGELVALEFLAPQAANGSTISYQKATATLKSR